MSEINQDVFEKVAAAISKQKEISADSITIDAEFETLGLDSLDATEILFDLEEQLDVDIPNDAARSMKNVRQVVEGLTTLVEGGEIPTATSATGDAAANPSPDNAENAP